MNIKQEKIKLNGSAESPMIAPAFNEIVRDYGLITLGDAKQFASTLPPEKHSTACGCYLCYSPKCPSYCLGGSCILNFCGGCLMYNPFLCACPNNDTPGAWCNIDMKGCMYFLVPVDEKGTFAWFSEHVMQGSGDSLKASCYCRKMC